jgi:hypothetical protein
LVNVIKKLNIFIFNKDTYELFEEDDNNVVRIPPNDTFFPLQEYDYIRFGDTTWGIDKSFTSKYGMQITSTSSIDLAPISLYGLLYSGPGTSSVNQVQYRIFRRLPKDNYVLIKNIPSYTDSGLLIPQNFNPNYDPYTLARKAGLIQ